VDLFDTATALIGSAVSDEFAGLVGIVAAVVALPVAIDEDDRRWTPAAVRALLDGRDVVDVAVVRGAHRHSPTCSGQTGTIFG
jgi:hypothetical protein